MAKTSGVSAATQGNGAGGGALGVTGGGGRDTAAVEHDDPPAPAQACNTLGILRHVGVGDRISAA